MANYFKPFILDPSKNEVYTFNSDGSFKIAVIDGKITVLGSDCFQKIDSDDIKWYKHDCDKCIFLDSFHHDKKAYDLYFCASKPTLIARYGNNGPDYMSGLEMADLLVPLKEAKRLAKLFNLID